MSAAFVRGSVVTDSDRIFLLGLSDLVVRQVAGRVFIYASSEYEGGLSSFELLADGSIAALQNIASAPASGTDAVADLCLVSHAGVQYLLPAGRYAQTVAAYALPGDGSFGACTVSGNILPYMSNLDIAENVVTKSGSFVYASRWDGPGLQCFKVGAGGSLAKIGTLSDTTKTYLRDVTDIDSLYFAGKRFLFTASGNEPGVQSHIIGTSGMPVFADKAGPSEKWGYSAPTVLESAVIGTQAFLVMGAGGSGTLTVFSVSSTGMVAPVDHLVDSRDTRFDGIHALTKIETAGRVFLLAGGADDGLTLLQLGSAGKLSVVAVIADDWDATLANVSAIEVKNIGGVWKVFAGSAGDSGFTVFDLQLGNLGTVLNGTTANNILTGTSADNDIYGNAGNDRLSGGQGDDRLCDGTGIDTLAGGPGTDIFDFADDGKTDTITDFEPGIDRIDLASFALIYHHSELAITARDYGFDIRFGDDLFVVKLAAATLAEPFTFGQEDFVFG